MNTLQKTWIRNRKGQEIAVVLEQPVVEGSKNQKGLAFVMHGLGGYKEQLMIRTIAETFLEENYAVVTFDTTNTFGESDGSIDDATTTNYFEDLEDILNWAKKGTDFNQSEWYQEPYCLVGHSLGGISTALFAEKNPELVKALAPIATVVSGKLSMEGNPERYEEWKRVGYEERKSNSKPGMVGRIKWSHMEDRLKYDLIPEVSKLTMPILMVVGSEDEMTPPKVEQILFDALPTEKKEIHIVNGASHTFKQPEHLAELKKYFANWIASL